MKKPKTFDPETRTADIVVSTETPVPRGSFDEVLSHAPSAVDLSRFIGAPFLNAHKQGDARDVLGVITAARLERGELIATVKFSRRPDAAPIIDDIADGIQTKVSAGYAVQKWADSTDTRTGRRVRTATRWRPLEASLVPSGADENSGFRADHRSPPMKKKLAGADPALEDDDVLENENVETVTTTRAATVAELDTIASTAKLDRGWVNTQREANATIEAARADAFVQSTRPQTHINTRGAADHSNPAELMTRQIGGYVAASSGEKPADNEREFAGLTTMQHLREMLERRGVSTRRIPDGEIIQRAISTGDAPEFFLGVGNRVVERAYGRARDDIMNITVLRQLPDYRPISFLRDGDFDGDLEEVSENGEFTRTSFVESKITSQVKDWARGFDVTERAIRNDDKGVTTRIPDKFGAMAAAKDAELVVGVITDNAEVDDGHNLFDAANHQNLTTAPTPLSIDALSDGRLAMRSLVGLDGQSLLNISPKFLIVSKELETVGEQLLSQISPVEAQSVNPFAGKLQLIVSARLPAYYWMLASDPAQAAVLAILRLSGQEGPRIESAAAWNTFAMQFRCKHTVNAAAVGWRGLALWTQGEDSNSVIFE